MEIARDSGLKNSYWSGHTDIPGRVTNIESKMEERYLSEGAKLAGSYAFYAGCKTLPRGCSACGSNQACGIKKYIPRRRT